MNQNEENYEIVDESDEVEQEAGSPEIEVVDDTPEADRGRIKGPPVEVSDEEISQYKDNVQKRIKDLRRAYHDERREKERAFREQQEAIRFAKSVAEQNKVLQERLSNGEQVYVEARKSGVNAQLNSAEKDYKDAHESGDVEKMVDAQKRIAKLSVEQHEVENYKPQFDPLHDAENVVKQIPQVIPDERTRRWVESNRWFETDPVMRGAALGLHDEMVAKGYQAGSEAYFEQIDARIRESFPQKFGQTKRPATVVASAGRTEQSSGKIKLRTSQINIAKRLGLPLDVYAKYAAQDQKEQ